MDEPPAGPDQAGERAKAGERDIDAATRSRLRRTVLLVAGLNLSYLSLIHI